MLTAWSPSSLSRFAAPNARSPAVQNVMRGHRGHEPDHLKMPQAAFVDLRRQASATIARLRLVCTCNGRTDRAEPAGGAHRQLPASNAFTNCAQARADRLDADAEGSPAGEVTVGG